MRTRISRIPALATLAGVVSLSCASLVAAPITLAPIVSDPGDYQIQFEYPSTTRGTSAAGTNLVIGQYATGRGANAVFVFHLPVLPAGYGVVGAELKTILHQPGTPELPAYNVDLWGIGFQNFVRVNESDLPPAIYKYLDSDTSSDPDTVKLLDNWFYEGQFTSGAVPVNTGTSGSEPLAEYLQTKFYDKTTNYTGNTYVYLRANPDADPRTTGSGSTGFSLRSRDYTVAGDRPTLTLTIDLVPEPSGLALVGLGGLALCRRRRGS